MGSVEAYNALLQRLRAHELRHEFCVLLKIENGMSGHFLVLVRVLSSVRQTRRLHLSDDQLLAV